ncbi:MAG TPA: LapA family protein [Oxalicibacterium sp.]|uniref:LapA family protein n=1 Tax=Oxalicibacterium sp. TaxID=2766525 RepID=UPI002B57AE72|nr:LapA family protein [Oxalicibacterium sp.]HWU96951.1 LapA family protein [Oxalicibacterium sp.]
MQIRTLLFVIVLGAIGGLAALNWEAFNTPTPLWLGVTTVQAPLGLVMLGLTALLTALFLVFIVYLQSSILLEARRHAKELQANRELADQAEASRFTELRRFIELEMQAVVRQDGETRTALLARMDRLDTEILAAVNQSGNSLAAYIGEVEDRLERDGKVAVEKR